MKVWGITGTNGKTTSTWVLAEFLRAAGRKCAYVTTVEVDTLKRKFSTGYTTPPLKTLKDIFAEAEANGATDCVMEVSSHAIHQHRFGDTVFAGAAFTNLTEDHLDYHKTMAAYFDAKLELFRYLALTNPGAPAVICTDGGYGNEMLTAVRKLSLNVHMNTEANYLPLDDLKLAGGYNRQNVTTAAVLAEQAGVSREVLSAAMRNLKPRWGRLEEVETLSKGRVFVDFAHTDDALRNVLRTAREFTGGKIWAVFGAGGDRDPMKRPLMGKAVAESSDRIVITSDNPRSEDPNAIIASILDGMREVGVDPANVKVEADRMAAIYFALENAQSGDTVVICGKGHETTQEIKGVKYPFDDRQVCRQFAGASR